MADFDLPGDPFDALRDVTRNAVLPEAAAVRARGRQRQVRSRVMYVATAAVVLAGGLTAGVAIAGSGSDKAVVVPTTQTPTPEATEEPTPTETPSAVPSSTPSATAPASSEPTEHLRIALSITNASATGLSYRADYSGLVPQIYSYDSQTHTSTPRDTKYPQDFGIELLVDGQVQSGSDGGETACLPEAPLVPVQGTNATQVLFRHGGQPISLAPGTHTAVWRISFCAQGKAAGREYTSSQTFTV